MHAVCRHLAAVLVALLVASGGCSKIPPTRSATRAADDEASRPAPVAPAGGADTPQEALLNYVRAYHSGDLELFKSSVYAADWQIAEASFRFGSSLQRWQNAMDATYGADVVRREQKRRGWGRRIFFSLMPPASRVDREARIAAGLDSAQAFIEDDPATLARDWLAVSLVKLDGRWRVAPTFGEEVVLRDPRLELRMPALRGTGKTRILAAASLADNLFDKIRGSIGQLGFSAASILDLYDAEASGSAQRRAAPTAATEQPEPPPQPIARPAPEEAATPPSSHQEAIEPQPLPDPDAPYRTYTIRPSDTLRKIARKVYGPGQERRYIDIYNANRQKLWNPNMLSPGTVLKIPP